MAETFSIITKSNPGHSEGGVPVFGSIKPTPPSSTSLSTSLLLLLLAGGVGAAALFKGNSVAISKNENKDDKSRARTEEPVDTPTTEILHPKTKLETLSLACSMPSPFVKEDKKTEAILDPFSPPNEFLPTPKVEEKCEEKTNLENEIESQSRKTEKTKKDKTIEENDSQPAVEKKMMDESAKLKEKTSTVPEITFSPEVAKNIVPVEIEEKIVKEAFPTEQSRSPSVKTRFEDLSINLTTVDELEEVDYITKIKTFKITRWPKTHTVDLVQHGPDSLLSVLLPLQLQVPFDSITHLFNFNKKRRHLGSCCYISILTVNVDKNNLTKNIILIFFRNVTSGSRT